MGSDSMDLLCTLYSRADWDGSAPVQVLPWPILALGITEYGYARGHHCDSVVAAVSITVVPLFFWLCVTIYLGICAGQLSAYAIAEQHLEGEWKKLAILGAVFLALTLGAGYMVLRAGGCL